MDEKKQGERSLVKLDFADVLGRVHAGRLMNPFESRLVLSEKNGHLYQFKGKHSISSLGYIHLNKIASINLVTPQTVVVDGLAQPNPHVERHKTTKAIETVNVRKIGIGFSAVGNIVAIDKTLFYNVYTYFIQSIQKKIKDSADCGFYGTRRDQPKAEKDKRWVFFQTAGPLGIWVNYAHKAIIDALEDHTQRQRFGDRIAQKIVERNILKDHPAIGISQVTVHYDESDQKKDNAKASIKLYGWRHELDSRNIKDIQARAERGDAEIEADQSIVEAEVEEEKAVIEEIQEEEIEPREEEAESEEPEDPEKSPATMEEPE